MRAAVIFAAGPNPARGAGAGCEPGARRVLIERHDTGGGCRGAFDEVLARVQAAAVNVIARGFRGRIDIRGGNCDTSHCKSLLSRFLPRSGVFAAPPGLSFVSVSASLISLL